MSLPAIAFAFVNSVPVSCIPSPESPTKRMVTVSTWTLLFAADAWVDMSPCVSCGRGAAVGADVPGKGAVCMPHRQREVKAPHPLKWRKYLGYRGPRPYEIRSRTGVGASFPREAGSPSFGPPIAPDHMA